MSVVTQPGTQPGISARPGSEVPKLDNGDRLTRAEFLRRYEALPDLKKAELIEGVVYVGSATRQKSHGQPHTQLIGWLFVYQAGTPGVEAGDNSTILLDFDNSPQPDGLLFIQPSHGGQVKLSADGYIEGAPELVAEVTASSVSYDLHDKLHAYRRNGVREYIVYRVLDQQLDWFVLREGRFESLAPSEDGLIRSTVFPGLWLDPAALVRGDAAKVLAAVQIGVNSPEHAEFVARLNSNS